jgi:hypothetical protein
MRLRIMTQVKERCKEDREHFWRVTVCRGEERERKREKKESETESE